MALETELEHPVGLDEYLVASSEVENTPMSKQLEDPTLLDTEELVICCLEVSQLTELKTHWSRVLAEHDPCEVPDTLESVFLFNPVRETQALSSVVKLLS